MIRIAIILLAFAGLCYFSLVTQTRYIGAEPIRVDIERTNALLKILIGTVLIVGIGVVDVIQRNRKKD